MDLKIGARKILSHPYAARTSCVVVVHRRLKIRVASDNPQFTILHLFHDLLLSMDF